MSRALARTRKTLKDSRTKRLQLVGEFSRMLSRRISSFATERPVAVVLLVFSGATSEAPARPGARWSALTA